MDDSVTFRDAKNDPKTRLNTGECSVIAAILLLLIVILVSLAARTGVTVDEPAHLLSSYLYWHGQDRLEPGDMPPLMKITSGWVPYLMGLQLPPRDHPDWKTNHEWNIGLAMMFQLSGDQIWKYFFYARLPMIIFPVGCCLLLWFWGRQLFSPSAALLTALAFALSPTVLAHSALVKNDLAAAFGFLFFWYRAWRYWQVPDLPRAAWIGIALLIGVLAKFSLLILAPIVPFLLIGRTLDFGWFSFRRRLLALATVAAINYVGVVAAWQFLLGRPDEIQMRRWNANPNIPRVLVRCVEIASYVPTPARFWSGAMSLVESNSGKGGTYLRGKVVEGGDPTYFVTALAVKIPIAQQALFLAGIAICIFQFARRRLTVADLLWFAPPFLYLGLASMSSLQHGVRLVLPAIVFLILIEGKAIHWFLSTRYASVLPLFLLLWLGARSASAYPDYISFFNQWIGGADNGIAMLSDSNLDWGQDIPRLAEYVQRRNIQKLRLAYFGVDTPHRHIEDRRIEWLAPPWNDSLVNSTLLKPEPGFYAISATLLTGQLFAPKYRNYFAAFRNLKPTAKAGYSIFIYEIP